MAKAVVRKLFAYRKYVRNITTDNGSEFAAHLDITEGLRMRGREKVTAYFADGYCSWQGGIENVNKLIRQYIPKHSNFNDFSDSYIRKGGREIRQKAEEKARFLHAKRGVLQGLFLILHLLVDSIHRL